MPAPVKNRDEKYIPALGRDFLTPLYDPVVRLIMREMAFRKSLIGQAAIGNGQKVLDLACGTGTLAILVKKAHPQARVIGIDGDAKILRIAATKAERENVRVAFDQGLSNNLPYADESFDCVLSTLFFHHLTRENKLKTFAEVRRVLKPGGEFHVADFGHPGNFLMRLSSEIIKRVDSPEATADNFDGLLPRLISESGFEGVRETNSFNSLFGTLRLYRALKA